MDFVNFFQHHWLIISFIAPSLWAFVNIIDVYFIGGVYKDELDGTIISGLFQIVPWIFLVFFLDVDFNRFIHFQSQDNFLLWVDPVLLIALFGGFLFTLAFYFYFKALFNHNDVALLQIIWSLTIIIVPILSFVLWGEKLIFSKYLGIGLVFIGIIILLMNKKIKNKFSRRYFGIMLGAVLFLSISMVFEDRAYSSLAFMGLGNQGFLVGFLCFSLGAFLGGIFFIILGRRNPLSMIKKYYKAFFIIEGISFLGTLASQRAIDLSPSVSYVAAIGTFEPIFIVVYSSLILFYFLYIINKDTQIVKRIYKEQIEGIWFKIIATIVMAVGIYIIS